MSLPRMSLPRRRREGVDIPSLWRSDQRGRGWPPPARLRPLAVLLSFAAAATGACGEASAFPPGFEGQPGQVTENDASSASSGTSDGGTGGSRSGTADSGTGGTDGAVGENGDGGVPVPDASSAAGLPCDVARVLEQHCASCHSEGGTAPMPLLGYEDLTAASVVAPSARVYEQVKLRIHDPQRPMPPVAASDPLTAEELSVLDAWIDQGAPIREDGCGVDGGTGGPQQGLDQSECELVAEFRAHGGQTEDDPTGYTPPLQDDHNESFYFDIPWEGDVHGLWIEPIVEGGERVVHHSILSVLGSSENPPGSHRPTPTDEFATRTLLVGWAPGGKPLTVPEGVGLGLPPKSEGMIQLEIHYNNSARVTASDRSGFRVCTTSQKRAETAVIHTLGEWLFELPSRPGLQTIRNTCTVADKGKGPIYVLSSMPHMHELGRRMVTTVKRPSGEVETLIDVPFDFRDQTSYAFDTPLEIHPGDVVTTDCIYENTTGQTVKYGEKTADEMCFNYVLAYPEGSLVGGVVSSAKENACIGLLGFL